MPSKLRKPQPRAFTLSIVGKGGAGKTEFTLHPEFGAPRPLTVVTCDPNTEAIVRKFRLHRADDVTIHKLELPTLAFDDREDVKEEAEERWNELRDVLRPIVKGEIEIRTIVLDTATEQYQLGIHATFGKSDQISPEARRNMMGPVNSRWKGITAALEQRGCNVILLHRAKNTWADVENEQGKETRKMLTGPFDIERDGYNGTEFMVSTEILLAFDEKREAPKVEGKFGMKIIRSQQRPALIGQEYWGRKKLSDGTRLRKASFTYLAQQLYPGTTLEDWR